jgi:hypothetical protein
VGWTMHRCMGLACAFLTFPNLCTIWTLVSVPKRTAFSTSRSSPRMHLISYSPLQNGKEGHTIWGSQNPQQRGARRATRATPATRRDITVAIGGCLLPATKCGWTVGSYITTSKGVYWTYEAILNVIAEIGLIHLRIGSDCDVATSYTLLPRFVGFEFEFEFEIANEVFVWIWRGWI